MLGLIVGESSLPKFLIAKLIKKKKNFLILDLTKANIYKKYNNSYSLKIGLFSLFYKKLITSLTVLNLENFFASSIPFFKRLFEKINLTD